MPASGFSITSRLAVATLIGCLCMALQSAQAATKEWTASSSTNLAGASNWTPTGAPATSDEVVFSSVPNTSLTTGNTLTWGDLVWNTNTSASMAIASGQSSNRVFTLSGGGGSSAATAAGGAAGDLILLGSNVTTATLVISGTTSTEGTGRLRMAVGADGNFHVKNAGAALTITADITGNYNLTKTGAGTLTLGAANTFGADKTFTVEAGTVNANHTAALGSGNVAVSGGSLTMNEAGVGSIILKADKSFSMSAGTLGFSFESVSSHDQIIGSGTGTFSITGGIIDLTNSITDYSVTYALFRDFSSGSVANLTFINYDNANYIASLGNDGVLSFSAIPESSTAAALLGGLVLALVVWHRRQQG